MRWWVVLHVVIAFGFVAGLIGRNITLAKARSIDDLGQVGRSSAWRPGSRSCS